VNWIDDEVAMRKSIEQYQYNPEYPHGRYLADERSLTSIETGPDGQLLYHYAKGTFSKDKLCYYHLVVEAKTHVVVGWGFDPEFGDPKKACASVA
jgi:hypothetical protein